MQEKEKEIKKLKIIGYLLLILVALFLKTIRNYAEASKLYSLKERLIS